MHTILYLFIFLFFCYTMCDEHKLRKCRSYIRARHRATEVSRLNQFVWQIFFFIFFFFRSSSWVFYLVSTKTPLQNCNNYITFSPTANYNYLLHTSLEATQAVKWKDTYSAHCVPLFCGIFFSLISTWILSGTEFSRSINGKVEIGCRFPSS